eukprot:2912519-Alexandrium_andersonii.AAC.1
MSMVSRTKVEEALGKLRTKKSSPDGVTAEMLRALPGDSKDAMVQDPSRRCVAFDFPAAWLRSRTTHAPKVVGASRLKQFRPIAGLCSMRKLLGYLWLWSLPQLVWVSVQTAFVPGIQGGEGVFMINRAEELSREWQVPLALVQLDLRKAFDHIDHRAAFRAMRLH